MAITVIIHSIGSPILHTLSPRNILVINIGKISSKRASGIMVGQGNGEGNGIPILIRRFICGNTAKRRASGNSRCG
ncbi:hypothetical protein ES703_79062 [subsurface metagenome]